MKRAAPVVVAIHRPPGYEDVHPELVVEDAMRPGWTYEIVRDEGTAVVLAIDRPEDYDRTPASALAEETVSATWPSWSLVKK